MERKINQEDWENLRLQLKTLVDIYADMNNDIVNIKKLMTRMTKVMVSHDKQLKKMAKPSIKS